MTRSYGFDKNGNRLSLASSPAAGDGTCQTTTGTTTKSWAWDTGDRTTNTGYVFDAFGRHTTFPAADAPKSGAGNVTLGYYDTDAIKSITQNGVTTTWTLDQAQRRSVETTGSKTTARHYADTGDNPAYVDVTESGVTTRTRCGSSLGGDLGLTISADGTINTAQVTLADPHGDVVATADVTSATAPAIGIAGWVDQDEYGNPFPAGSTTALTKGVGYGWVGAKQRATLDTGLLLMGARVYDPATGGFTSTDPVYGGNDTTYAYPLDPINAFDLDGRWNPFKKAWNATKSAANWTWNHRGTVASVAAIAGCAAPGVGWVTCGAAGVTAAFIGAQHHQGTHFYKRKKFWTSFGIGVAATGIGLGIAKGIGTMYRIGRSGRLPYRAAYLGASSLSHHLLQAKGSFLGWLGESLAHRRWG